MLKVYGAGKGRYTTKYLLRQAILKELQDTTANEIRGQTPSMRKRLIDYKILSLRILFYSS